MEVRFVWQLREETTCSGPNKTLSVFIDLQEKYDIIMKVAAI